MSPSPLFFRSLYGPRMLNTVLTKPVTPPRPKENKSTPHSRSPSPRYSLLMISCPCSYLPRDIDASGYLCAFLISCVLYGHMMLIAVSYGGVSVEKAFVAIILSGLLQLRSSCVQIQDSFAITSVSLTRIGYIAVHKW